MSEREKLLKQINECGGLWGILENEARLENLETEKEKRMALKIQLNFHQKVLGVKCCRSLFAMTSGGKVKHICVLIKNLKEVISWSKDSNSNTNAEIDFSRPIFVTQAALEKENKIFKERAAQTTQKEKERALGQENIPLGKKQRKRTIEPVKKWNLKKAKESPEAVVTSTDDLVGKVQTGCTGKNRFIKIPTLLPFLSRQVVYPGLKPRFQVKSHQTSKPKA